MKLKDRIFLVVFGCVWLSIVGCSHLSATEPLAHAALLEVEYEQVRDSLRDLDLSVEERLQLESSITIFENTRRELHDIGAGGINFNVLVAAADADRILDGMAQAFKDGEEVIQSHHTRVGKTIPIEYVRYKDSATRTYNFIKDRTEGGASIPWLQIQNFSSLALRTYIALRSGVVL